MGERGVTMSAMLVHIVAGLAILLQCSEARSPYIIGGHDVSQPGAYPWQASLQINGGKHNCGASLISQNWLLTAAHCVPQGPSYYTVVLGLHDKDSQLQGRPEKYTVKTIIRHPEYQAQAMGFPNDIALIELNEEVDLSNEYVSTIKLADAGEDFFGNENCWITGWGQTKSHGSNRIPNVLQEVNISIYKHKMCELRMAGIGDFHICLGGTGESGSCVGDSGGPLACKVGGTWTLAGATSWGLAGCPVKFPSVYSRVSHFRAWIDRTMSSGSGSCSGNCSSSGGSSSSSSNGK